MRWSPVRVIGLLVGAGLVVGGVTGAVRLSERAGAGEARAATVDPAWVRPAVAGDSLAGRSGVRLVRVAISGDGGLLDLRFQVVDPVKAAAVHEASTPPAIVDERTGLVVHDLLMNHAHTGEFKPAVTYYLVFHNPGGWVQRGTSVTVLLGGAQVEHVVVA